MSWSLYDRHLASFEGDYNFRTGAVDGTQELDQAALARLKVFDQQADGQDDGR